MEVELDENPLEYGPQRLNVKVAEVRRFLAATEKMFMEVSHWIQQYKSTQRAAKVLLDLEVKNLLANDPEVRTGRNLETMQAVAHMKLRPEVEAVSKLDAALEDLDALMAVIKSKRYDLKDIQGRIREQTKLCQEEIGLGGRWGSKPPPGSNAPTLPPEKPKTSLKELREHFQQPEAAEPEVAEPEVADSLDLTSSVCSVCGGQQFSTPSGVSCPQGHGGAPAKPLEDLIGEGLSDSDSDGFLSALDEEGTAQQEAASRNIDDILADIGL